MKKIITLVLTSIFLLSVAAKANEGMWILTLLNKNYEDMKKQGFKLSPEDIYSLNKASIKDAIVIFGGGCTGEIVSDKGLLFTNHHCGYRSIQSQSSVEHNYLRDGFWAKNFKEELPIPGLSVRFFKRIEDVSKQINEKLNKKMSFDERNETIKKISKEIEDAAKKGNNYIARVQSFFNGNNFYLVIYEKYDDVRLVGTPPESIGKFGHDSDNWVWPRHTGDFSIFRVYMSKDGKASEYNADNIPLKPKYHLPISLKGVKKDDFTMVIGFPGRTNRYITSYGIQEMTKISNINRIKIRGARQELMMEDMIADEKIKIQYSSKFSGSSNYWKYSIGMNKGLKKLNVYEKKKDTENKFTKWVSGNKNRIAKYGRALDLIKNAYEGRKELTNASQYIAETMLRGIEIYNFARIIDGLKDNPEKMKSYSEGFFKDYSMKTDKKIAVVMLKLFDDGVDEKYYPDFFKTIQEDFKGNFSKYVDHVYSNSILVSKEKFDKFLKSNDIELLSSDPAYIAGVSVFKKYKELNDQSSSFFADLTTGRRLYLAGLMEMESDKHFYPDANSTMRLSYGKIGDYKPKDAVFYDYYTTLEGVMEKEIPGDFEFDVHPKLKELYHKKDYGRYGQDDKMVVCFTSDDDITGGNSGSPIMNGNGELIGLAFDGNWEAMSGDIAFETELQKCICVDIRYVLFIIDKFGGATNLIEELTIKE